MARSLRQVVLSFFPNIGAAATERISLKFRMGGTACSRNVGYKFRALYVETEVCFIVFGDI